MEVKFIQALYNQSLDTKKKKKTFLICYKFTYQSLFKFGFRYSFSFLLTIIYDFIYRGLAAASYGRVSNKFSFASLKPNATHVRTTRVRYYYTEIEIHGRVSIRIYRLCYKTWQ